MSHFGGYFGSYFAGYFGSGEATVVPAEPAQILAGMPIGARPIASAILPPSSDVSPFIELQGQAVVDVVTLVILRPFTREAGST